MRWIRAGAIAAAFISSAAGPAAAATPKARKAARLTWAADLSPEATRRTGPTRAASVPRTPSE